MTFSWNSWSHRIGLGEIPALSDGEWHIVQATVIGDDVKVMVDGEYVPVSTGAVGDPLPDRSDRFGRRCGPD